MEISIYIGCGNKFEASLEEIQAEDRYSLRGRAETWKLVKVEHVAKTEL